MLPNETITLFAADWDSSDSDIWAHASRAAWSLPGSRWSSTILIAGMRWNLLAPAPKFRGILRNWRKK